MHASYAHVMYKRLSRRSAYAFSKLTSKGTSCWSSSSRVGQRDGLRGVRAAAGLASSQNQGPTLGVAIGGAGGASARAPHAAVLGAASGSAPVREADATAVGAHLPGRV